MGATGSTSITTFESRLPIPAGGYVGLVPPPSTGNQTFLPGSSATYQQVNDGADGGSGDFSGYSTSSGEVLYDADIEPDADHDGYGDITQDACPTDPSTQGECPASTGGGAGGGGSESGGGSGSGKGSGSGGGSGGGGAPAISGFKAAPSRFRVAKGGAVVSGGGTHAGTTLRLSLSERAKVAFKTERKVKGKWKLVFAFKRDLRAGRGAIPYSGRYRKHGKVKSLKPGAYRIDAVPTDAAGRTGPVARAALTVVH